jgi:putative PIN family toxin of toxin-antitoxin system
MKVVIDTNVLVSALKSRRGASYRLISLLPTSNFSIAISVPLILEYEDVLKRESFSSKITKEDIDDFIDFLCHIGSRQSIFFLWRPFLPDPSDDLVLEVAVAGGCDAIIIYNKRHFRNIEKFGLKAIDSKEFLTDIGVIS